ncbi:MAG: OmcA/MtrC family decaheme c-type cytochrome, partial [Steroidobacteraceae bacterium]|nr:OmcA/MtrC family decaheme c-type cytochrome [Steroidobacteraceae bacterium]
MWLKDKGFTHRFAAAAIAGVLALGLAACEGDDGSLGTPGSPGGGGPTGPTGPGSSGVVNASQADVIFPTVTGVTVGQQTVVNFRLADSQGRGVVGLTPGNLRLALAKLVPGTQGGSSYWQSYINVSRAPVPGFDGTTAEFQATTETATPARLVDNGNGSYRYTFSFDINNVTTPIAVPYEASRTHRVALQIDGAVPVDNNASYTWQPSSGATTGLFSREIVDNDTCNACHDGLAFHGGRRNDTQYCVTCHNPGSVDPESTNTVNMSTMVHNIHAGAQGGVVLDGGRYYIVGYRNTVYDYSEIQFTQDVRNCQTCHQESDTDTPDASNWRTVVNAEACGSCHHSNVDFATGKNHIAGAATDDQCSACHGPNTTFAGGALTAQNAHRIPTVEAGRRFQFNLLSVAGTQPGQFPVVTFSVTDPTSNNAPYNIHSDAPFTQCAGGASRLFVDIGWTTADYTNVGTGVNPAQPVQLNTLNACGGNSVDNGNGTFSATSPVAVPAGLTGSLAAALEGHPALDADGNGSIDRIAVKNAIRYAAITGNVVARRTVVEITRCNECHQQLSLHGNNRTDSIETCVLCHAPGATDVNRRVAGSNCETVTGTLDDQTIDMKVMIHAIHAGPLADYQVCGFGNAGYDYSDVTYVGKLNNCEGCHKPDTYYPVDSTAVVGPTL